MTGVGPCREERRVYFQGVQNFLGDEAKRIQSPKRAGNKKHVIQRTQHIQLRNGTRNKDLITDKESDLVYIDD